MFELLKKLPNLRELRLFGCHQVSVDGLIVALRQYSEKQPIQISVYDCQQFTKDGYGKLQKESLVRLELCGVISNGKEFFVGLDKDNPNNYLHHLLVNNAMLCQAQWFFLLGMGVDINSVNETPTPFDGYQPLHIAAKVNNVPLLKRLLDAGAKIEATDNSGETAYQKALKYGSFAASRELRLQGAERRAFFHARDEKRAKEAAASVIQDCWKKYRIFQEMQKNQRRLKKEKDKQEKTALDKQDIPVEVATQQVAVSLSSNHD